jgi:hypothetical protein
MSNSNNSLKLNHMKYLFYLLLTVFTISISSCRKDLLDSSPRDQYSDAVIWKDSTLVLSFLNSIYSRIPSEYESSQDMLSNFTDDSANKSLISGSSNNYNKNQEISSTSPFNTLYTNLYAGIRQCNLFLENIDGLNASQGLKTRMTAEVRFLRALYYHYVFNYFGRFPIVKQTLSINSNYYIQRGTEAECLAFITADLNEAAPLLPLRYTGQNVGRVTKGAALALLSRVYLYSGQWKNASDAALAVMGLNTYTLFPDYAGIFIPQNENNSEVIFDKQYLPQTVANQVSQFDFHNQPPDVTGRPTGANTPSGNLVDSYDMKDGSKFSWDNPVMAANPYANRDPRLDASVIHDGSVWKGAVFDMRRGTIFNPQTGPSMTGYWIRKFLDPNFVSLNSATASGQNFIILRYAEVLLNYAEAQLNLGNTEEARQYVNRVRARPSVNMPPIQPADFNAERYRNERRVELALEGTRLWDINRWKIGPQTRGADLTGVLCTDVAGRRTYTKVVTHAAGVLKIFVDKMYLFPIPLAEIQKYPAATPLDQNPGW